MADNRTLRDGDGNTYVVRTLEDASGNHFQYVVSRGRSRVYRNNPALTLTSYSANDVVGTDGDATQPGLYELPNAVREAGAGCFIHSVHGATSKGGLSLRLVFFDAKPTASTFTNDAAININFADQEKIVASVTLSITDTYDTNTYHMKPNSTSASYLPCAIAPVSGTSLWYAIEIITPPTDGAFTNAGDIDLTIVLYDE